MPSRLSLRVGAVFAITSAASSVVSPRIRRALMQASLLI
jgi:hypothetical protein